MALKRPAWSPGGFIVSLGLDATLDLPPTGSIVNILKR